MGLRELQDTGSRFLASGVASRHSANTTTATSHLPSQRCPGRAIFPGAGCSSGSPGASSAKLSSSSRAALRSEPLKRPSSATAGLEVLPSRRLLSRSSPPGRPGGLTGQPPPTRAWAAASEGSLPWPFRRTGHDGGSAPPGAPAGFRFTPRDCWGLRALYATGSPRWGLGSRPDASTVPGSAPLGRSRNLPKT